MPSYKRAVGGSKRSKAREQSDAQPIPQRLPQAIGYFGRGWLFFFLRRSQ